MQAAEGTARASTITKYSRQVERLAGWLATSREVRWPTDVAQVVDYRLLQLDMPCSPSFTGQFLQALSWIVNIGGYPPERCFAAFAVVVRTTRKMAERLEVGVEQKTQAP